MNYTLKPLPSEFRLSDDLAETVAEISPALREQLARDLMRAFDENLISLATGTASAGPAPEPLNIDGVLSALRMANRRARRKSIESIFDRSIAHALTLGYMAGIAGTQRDCPWSMGMLYTAWHEGRTQGREHRARTHEGSPSILTQRSIEAALIRLGML